MFRHFLFAQVLLVASLLPAAAQDARAILEAARMNPLGQPVAIDAQLRSGKSQVPFRIEVRDGRVSYIFQNPDQEIILGFGENASTLSERIGGKSGPVSAAKFDDPVRGGLLSYEDLALQFLYWPNPKLLGEETIRTRKAWKIEIQGAPEKSQYAAARVWVDQQSGALLRMEGYNREGKLAKRFEVVSAQKIDGQWMLKQMRVERLDPDSQKLSGRMYLEVTGKSDL